MNDLFALYVIPYIVGLVTNASSSFLSGTKEEYKTTIGKLIEAELREVADTIDIEDIPRFEEICLFFTTPEVQHVVEQLFSVHISKQDLFSDVENEFIKLFDLHFGNVTPKDRDNIIKLYKIIEKTVVTGLLSRETSAEIANLKAITNYRFNRIEALLSSVKNNLLFLESQQVDVAAILEFEEKYRKQVENRFKYIEVYNLDFIKKIPINDIFVAPELKANKKIFISDILKQTPYDNTSLPENVADEFHAKVNFVKINASIKSYYNVYSKRVAEEIADPKLNLKQFYNLIDKTIILGNPGGGKSTLTRKISYDLARNYDERLVQNKLLTPIHIIVKDYADQKSKHNFSLISFIENNAKLNFHLTVPKNAFEYLLSNCRALLIFDGLDELLDSSKRREIVEDIESFCNLYSSTPVLVTSREVGYEQAPLSEEFDLLRLSDFDDSKVEEYALKFFGLDDELSKEECNKKAASFLNESASASDIRSNPLMLGLMCSIYRGENYIPQNRSDLYEKCSVMLFERWDKSRGISANLPFEHHLKPGMMFLAYWMFTDSNLNKQVNETQLVNKITDYLADYYPNRNEANHIARQFSEFCRGRAWIFTDVGNDIYKFTHQTFLEYFTAYHLVRKCGSAEKLFDKLINKIINAEWDVVSQLALQIIDKNQENSGNKFINQLLDYLHENHRLTFRKKFNVYNFIFRALDFIFPHYKTLGKIIEQYLNFMFSNLVVNSNVSKADIKKLPLIKILVDIKSENRTSIPSLVTNYLIKRLKKCSDDDLVIIYFILHTLKLQEKNLRDLFNNRLEMVTDSSRDLSWLCQSNLVEFSRFFDEFGFNTIFHKPHFFDNTSLASSADHILIYLADETDGESINESIQIANHIFENLQNSFDINKKYLFYETYQIDQFVTYLTSLKPNKNISNFGFLIFKLSLAEHYPRRFGFEDIIIFSRYNNELKGLTEVQNSNYSFEQKKILIDWINNKFNFTTTAL